jgi:methylation protein EvaC
VLNFCGIGPDLVEFIGDSTVAKQGLVTPGQRIPVRPSSDFTENYPDYALLFAWNHAEEIMAKEQEFVAAGGRWLLYVPDVHVI